MNMFTAGSTQTYLRKKKAEENKSYIKTFIQNFTL